MREFAQPKEIDRNINNNIDINTYLLSDIVLIQNWLHRSNLLCKMCKNFNQNPNKRNYDDSTKRRRKTLNSDSRLKTDRCWSPG